MGKKEKHQEMAIRSWHPWRDKQIFKVIKKQKNIKQIVIYSIQAMYLCIR
jgi:hypothetical protein